MPRLYHTKSRGGCTRCKARRVKCDEARPACAKCVRHEVQCVYSGPPSRSPNSSSDARTADAQALEQRQALTAPTPQDIWLDYSDKRRILELHLLNLFINQVSHTIPGTHQTINKQRWAVEAPSMALKHEPLLHSMFALTILYIVITTTDVPFSADDLLIYRAKYIEATLVNHRQALDHLGSETTDQISYTAAILSTDALACLRDRVLEPYEPPHEWLHMSQGTKSVFKTTLDLVRGNPRSGVLSLHHSSSHIWDPSNMRSPENMNHFPQMLAGFDVSEIDQDDDIDRYTDAVCFIAAADIAREAGEPSMVLARRIVIFPCYVEPRFVQLVTSRKPRALVILAHLFGLALFVGDHWFIGNTPSREIIAIDRFLGPEWHPAMSWPMAMVQNHLNKA